MWRGVLEHEQVPSKQVEIGFQNAYQWYVTRPQTQPGDIISKHQDHSSSTVELLRQVGVLPPG